MLRLLRALLPSHRDERGVTAVEFSLLTIPLFVLTVGVFDFGLGIWAYNNLSQATNDAARYAVVRGAFSSLGASTDPGNSGSMTCAAPPPAGSIIERACLFARPLDPSKLTVTVTWPGAKTVVGTVQVRAEYLFEPILRNVFPFPTMNLKSQATMRIACCQQ
jgi:Flp pilus assembly protein TadG